MKKSRSKTLFNIVVVVILISFVIFTYIAGDKFIEEVNPAQSNGQSVKLTVFDNMMEVSALLPEHSTVAYKIERGQGTASHRLQLLCDSSLSKRRILSFYDTELAIRGWKKYNGKLPQEFGALGAMFRKGRLSLALHVLDSKKGSAFRISVVRASPVKIK